MKKILILFGDNGHLNKVSYESVRSIINNINLNIYDISLLVMESDGRWYLINDYMDILKENDWHNCNKKQVVNILKFVSMFDRVFPVLNGLIQELFKLANNKFIGVNLESFGICFNKRIIKIICAHYKIPIIPYIEINDFKKIKQINITFPVIVKSVRCNLPKDINIVNNIDELNKFIKIVRSHNSQLIIEKFIKARKFKCAIFKNKKIHISEVGEIKNNNLNDCDIDYGDKYKITCPVKIDKILEIEIKMMALSLFNILNINKVAIFDFLYDYNNHILYFNKINTIVDFNMNMFLNLFKSSKLSTKKIINSLIDGSN